MITTVHRAGWRALRAGVAALGLVVFTASRPDAGNSPALACELVYLFDAANALHLDRADRLHAALASIDRPVALYGVVADGAARQIADLPFAASARAWGVESELLTAAEAWRAGLGPQGLLPAGGDRLALRDGAGREIVAGSGSQLERVLQPLRSGPEVSAAGISTDVSFSTWGKVKDLFR